MNSFNESTLAFVGIIALAFALYMALTLIQNRK